MIELHKNIENLMKSVNFLISYMSRDIELENDEWLTSENTDDLILVATTEEFMVLDKDKLPLLQFSKNNRFYV